MHEKTSYDFLNAYADVVMPAGGIAPAFFCAAGPGVLFDPGVSAFGPCYLEQIRRHATDPGSAVLALTHSHFDHAGAAPYLHRKLPGTRIAASLKAAQILNKPSAIRTIRRLNAEYERDMADRIGTEDVSFEALTVDFKLQDGDRLELGNGCCFEIIETPGHTNDSLSYYAPDTGIVIAGEAAGVFEDGFMHSPYLTSFNDYINSIEKLRSLHPAALCIAHNGILAGAEIKRFLTEAATAARSYRDMIERYLLQYHGDQARVVARITAEEYDARPSNIQKRTPFLLNLEAKVAVVAKAWGP